MENNTDSKLEFQNILTKLTDKAIKNQYQISTDEVKEAFFHLTLDETQYEQIYQYLRSQNIMLSDSSDASASNAFSGKDTLTEEMIMTAFAPPEGLNIASEEKEFIQMYLDELNSIVALPVSEEACLIKHYYLDTTATVYKEQLIHNSLSLVIHSLDSFKDKGVSAGDLIQEGNLGLLEGIATFHFEDDLNSKQLVTAFHCHLVDSIETAMNDAIHEQMAASDIGEHLANRANTLDRASSELSKKLNREPTIKELSQHLGLPEDEIQNIIKYSLDALTVQADTKVV